MGMSSSSPVDTSSEEAQFITRSVEENCVVIFSKSYCPYCKEAKGIFKRLGAKFETVELDYRPDGAKIQDILAQMTGARTNFHMAEGTSSTTDGAKLHDCSICFEKFKSPKLLPCYHTFCLTCLDAHINKNKKEDKFLCPLCRAEITVPMGGVEKFQSNFYIETSLPVCTGHEVPCDICGPKSSACYKCTDCDENFCKHCSESHLKMKMARHHKLVEIASLGSSVKRKLVTRVVCQEHPNEELKFVCKQCGDKLLCIDCKLTEHENHNTKHVTNEAKLLREALSDILYGKMIDDQLGKLLNQIDIKAKTLKIFYNKLENDLENIKECAEQMHKAVDYIMTEKRQEATQFYTTQLKKTETEKDELEHNHQSYVSFRENVRLLLDHESDMNILKKGNELRRAIETLTQLSALDCQVEYVLGFWPGNIDRELMEECFGVFTGEVRPKTGRPALKGEESLTLVSSFTIPVHGQVTGIAPSKNNKAWISCWDHHELYLVDTQGNIERTVDIGGGCDFVIISGVSDCVVSCMEKKCISLVTSTGDVTTVVDDLDMYPHGLAFGKGLDENEELVYTCTDNTLFEAGKGYTKKQHAKAGDTLASEVAVPIRVAVDSVSGRMCLADFTNQCISLYDGKGKFISQYSKDSIEPSAVVFYEADSLDLLVCNCDEDIRLVSLNGSCTTILLEGKEFRSVVVDDNNSMWIGLNGGAIEVYQIH